MRFAGNQLESARVPHKVFLGQVLRCEINHIFSRIFEWIITNPSVLANDYHMIRAAVGQLIFSTLIWKDQETVGADHPFAHKAIVDIFHKYEKVETEEAKNIFNTMLFTLNKIIAFGLPGTWKWLGVLLKETGQAEFSDDSDRDKMTRCLVGKILSVYFR